MIRLVCKLCIIKKGLKMSDLEKGKCNYAFNNETEFYKHLRDMHNIKTKEKLFTKL